MFITQEELDKMIEDHKSWLENKDYLNGTVRFNVCHKTLEDVVIRDCDLSEALFFGCTFIECHFINCTLDNACYVNTMFTDTVFNNCSMNNIDFRGAVINSCQFKGCGMNKSVFSNSYIRSTEIHDCDFTGCDFSQAIFFDMYSDCQDVMPFIPLKCPETGSFIGYKKALVDMNLDGEYTWVIVKLRIPEDAKRTSGFSRKCRCSKAEVLEITKPSGARVNRPAFSMYNYNFTYRVGDIITEEEFCEDRYRECAQGIHFFITRKEAENYNVFKQYKPTV